MKRIMIACVAVAAFAAPAFAEPVKSQGPVNNNTANASAQGRERSFDSDAGANIFSGRAQGAFGALQSVVAPPSASGLGEPEGPYGQVVLQDGA